MFKFDPPVMPFEYTKEQARQIAEYYELYCRMNDVYDEVYDKLWFIGMPSDVKYQFIEDAAFKANEYIADNDDVWTDIDLAIDETMEEYLDDDDLDSEEEEEEEDEEDE